MIPVMLAGTFLYGRKYAPAEYMCTLLVAGGVSMFALFKVSNRPVACKVCFPVSHKSRSTSLGFGGKVPVVPSFSWGPGQ